MGAIILMATLCDGLIHCKEEILPCRCLYPGISYLLIILIMGLLFASMNNHSYVNYFIVEAISERND